MKSLELLPLDYIVITHNHWDHNQAVPAILEEIQEEEVEVLAHPEAIPLLENPERKEYDFGMGPLLSIEDVKPIEEGDVLSLGGLELEVIETPGHSHDCISLLDSRNENIFVSDAIMDKTDNTTFVPAAMPPTCDFEEYKSTLEKLREVNWNSVCLGHYGMFYGKDAKNILDEGRQAWEKTWGFFDNHNEKLNDIEWVTESLIQEVMPDSKTVQRAGIVFAQGIVNWLVDGYKMSKGL